MEVTVAPEEASEIDNLAAKLVADNGEVDPTLELSKFIFPHLELLKKYDTEGSTIDQEELEDNKNKIVETLNNYKKECRNDLFFAMSHGVHRGKLNQHDP